MFSLQGVTDKLPKINVLIESNSKFSNANFHTSTNIDTNKTYDLLIDISVLQRSGLSKINDTIKADTKVLIRLAHSPKTNRSFKTAENITYKNHLAKRIKKKIFLKRTKNK